MVNKLQALGLSLYLHKSQEINSDRPTVISLLDNSSAAAKHDVELIN